MSFKFGRYQAWVIEVTIIINASEYYVCALIRIGHLPQLDTMNYLTKNALCSEIKKTLVRHAGVTLAKRRW